MFGLKKKKEKDIQYEQITKELSYPYGINEIDKEKNMILSKNISIGFDNKITKNNCNSIVFGNIGTGKIRNHIIPNLLQANCNYIITTKIDEIYTETKDFFISQNYKIKYLNLSNQNISMKYNPFKHIKNDIDIIKISEILTNKIPDNIDPFLPNVEKILLCICIDYMTKNYIRSEWNIKLLIEIIKKAEENIDLFASMPINSLGYKNYTFYKTVNETIKQSIIISLIHLLNSIYENASNILTKDEINFDDFKKDKIILYIILPQNKSNIDFLATLLIEQINEYLINDCNKNNTKLKYHLKIILNDIDNLIKIENLENLLSNSKLYNISFSITANSILKLKECNYDLEIIEFCDILMFFGTTEYETAEYISKLISFKVVEEENNKKYLKNKLLPEELLRMPIENCYIRLNGYTPFIDEKYNLYNHKNYNFLNFDFNNILKK